MEAIDGKQGRGFRLSTAKEFYACSGTLGISPDDPNRCTYGSDGAVYESWQEPREGWLAEAEAAPAFTPDERAEIAAYMVRLWCHFGDIHVDFGPHSR